MPTLKVYHRYEKYSELAYLTTIGVTSQFRSMTREEFERFINEKVEAIKKHYFQYQNVKVFLSFKSRIL